MGNGKIGLLLLFLVVVVLLHVERSEQSSNKLVKLKPFYYSRSCPKAEAIIRNVVQRAFHKDPGVAAGLLRLHFHDCFVRGCDASVLLDGSASEKMSIPNSSLQPEALALIDDAKMKLEAACPGIVSCADIVAYAARDGVVLTKGPTWDVPAGRKDGTVSLKSEPLKSLPAPFFNITLITQAFKNVGLNQNELVVLIGAHTIGSSECTNFIQRLYNFNATFDIDPTLDRRLAKALRRACPRGNPNHDTEVDMDSTATKFDNSYFKGLMAGKGLFTSDEALFLDPSTTKLVRTFAYNQPLFLKRFADAMIKMSRINVLTGSQGQIRKKCRHINK